MAQYLQTEIDIFKSEIDKAQKIVDNPNQYNQTQVDNENDTLKNLLEKFNSIGINYIEVDTLVAASKELYLEYITNKDTKYNHVSSTSASNFNSVITNTIIGRNNILDSCKLNNDDYDKIVAESTLVSLRDTIQTAYDNFKEELNTIPVDKSDLITLIETCQNRLTLITKGSNVNQCPDPYYTNLVNSIDKAIEIKNKNNPTNKEVSDMIIELTDSLNIFNSKIIEKAFTGYIDSDNNKYYGPAPREDFPNEEWVPAEIINGIYVSPEPMPENVNSPNRVCVDSLVGYNIDGTVITQFSDSKVNIGLPLEYGNVYFSSEYNAPILITEKGLSSEAEAIYNKFNSYFASKGLQQPTIKDEMFFKATKKWFDYTEELSQVIPESGYYLAFDTESAEGRTMVSTSDIQEYFGCIATV